MATIPIKDAAGIVGMRASCRLARKILEELVLRLEPGRTTGEVDEWAGQVINQYGARSAFFGYRKFPGQLCISVNEEVVHGIGGPRRLAYGDVVKLDVGILLNGWVGYSVVKEFVGHGVGRKLHEEPQIPNFGRANSGPILRPGMTLAIEPMVNEGIDEVRILKDGWTAVTADRRDSAHFEHVILITEGDPEILTQID